LPNSRVGEEFSKANVAIFQQVVVLRTILNLPISMFGDFNIDMKDLRNLGLLQAHSLSALELTGDPSIRNGYRKIDDLTYSGSMNIAILTASQIVDVPLAYFGYSIQINGAALVAGTKLHIPKPLPPERFELKWQIIFYRGSRSNNVRIQKPRQGYTNETKTQIRVRHSR